MFKLPTELPELLQKYYQILVEEFMREWQFLIDVVGGRTKAKADFTDKFIDSFKILGIGDLPLPGMSLVNTGLEMVIDVANDKRKEVKQDYFASQQYLLNKSTIRVIAETAALEACRRYQYMILMLLTEDPAKGIVPFAKGGVERMLQYLGRKKLSVTEDNLVMGLIAGQSGAFVSTLFNTPLGVKNPRDKKLKNLFSAEYSVQGVCGRAGLMSKDFDLYALRDPSKVRHKQLSVTDKEKYIDYGYAKLADDSKNPQYHDPKYGYMYVSQQVINDLYGHLDITEVKQTSTNLSEALQRQLELFQPVIVAFDKRDLENYLLQLRQSTSPSLTLLAYMRKNNPKAREALYLIYDVISPNDLDLSMLDLEGANFDNCSFLKCIFGGSLDGSSFKNSALKFADFTRVKSAERIDLTDANLAFANAANLNLAYAILNQSDWSHANLTGANLSGVRCFGATWSNAILKDIKGDQEQTEAIKKSQEQQQQQLLKLESKLEDLELKLQTHYTKLQEMRTEYERGAKQNEQIRETLQLAETEIVELRINQIDHQRRIALLEETQNKQAQANEEFSDAIGELEKSMQVLTQKYNLFQNVAQQTKLNDLMINLGRMIRDSSDTNVEVKEIFQQLSSLEEEMNSSHKLHIQLQGKFEEINILKDSLQQDWRLNKNLSKKMRELENQLEEKKAQGKLTVKELEEDEKIVKLYKEQIQALTVKFEETKLNVERRNKDIKISIDKLNAAELAKEKVDSLNTVNKIVANSLSDLQKSANTLKVEEPKQLHYISFALQDMLDLQIKLAKDDSSIAFKTKFKAIYMVLEKLELYYLKKQTKLIRTKAKSRDNDIRILVRELKKLAADSAAGIKDILVAITTLQKNITTSKLDSRKTNEKSSLLYSYLDRAVMQINILSAEALQAIQQSETVGKVLSPNMRSRGVSIMTPPPQDVVKQTGADVLTKVQANTSSPVARARGVSMKTPSVTREEFQQQEISGELQNEAELKNTIL